MSSVLDFWFGEKNIETENKSIFASYFSKPRYVRYTYAGLKKASTKRLFKMFENIFGYIINDRYTVIEILFEKLNEDWDKYQQIIWQFDNERGVWFIDNTNPNNPYGHKSKELPKKRGRKVQFSYRQAMEILHYAEQHQKVGVVALAEMFNTTTFTISQIINCKYASIVAEMETENE